MTFQQKKNYVCVVINERLQACLLTEKYWPTAFEGNCNDVFKDIR